MLKTRIQRRSIPARRRLRVRRLHAWLRRKHGHKFHNRAFKALHRILRVRMGLGSVAEFTARRRLTPHGSFTPRQTGANIIPMLTKGRTRFQGR